MPRRPLGDAVLVAMRGLRSDASPATTATAVEVNPNGERERAYEQLARRDDALARLIVEHGRPDPFSWKPFDEAVRGGAFAELTLHIVSQQISTRAALTIYARVRTLLNSSVTPAQTMLTPVESLRATGMSTAKAKSVRDLAERVNDGRLSFVAISGYDDTSAQTALEAVRGIGPWSAQMFLLHYYRRPDILPAGDAALLRGAQSAFAPFERATPAELAARAERWRPYRSYAAALLWAHARSRQTSSAPLSRTGPYHARPVDRSATRTPRSVP